MTYQEDMLFRALDRIGNLLQDNNELLRQIRNKAIPEVTWQSMSSPVEVVKEPVSKAVEGEHMSLNASSDDDELTYLERRQKELRAQQEQQMKELG